ncbi:Tim44/TimA family putative adaptor protein [Bartonella sp. DGB1]|uniref:Tim44/TimA family putative adaptor protein n=1 Tax=Bartonella sp. DGB1 TaxID=3239807 RepID=UPI0035262E58
MDYLTIVSLGALVILIIALWRFSKILGTKIGYDGENYRKNLPTQPSDKNVVIEKITEKVNLDKQNKDKILKEIDNIAGTDIVLRKNLITITEKDSEFSPKKFTEISQRVYENVMQAFVEGDKEVLAILLDDYIYNDFVKVIKEREKSGQYIKYSFIGIDKFTILDAKVKGSIANITVVFVSQLISATYDKNDNLISGDPHKIAFNKDVWTFQKNLKNEDPTWKIVDTYAQD